MNIYIVYRLSSKTNNSNIVLENCLFGAVKVTKHDDPDKCKYSGWGIGFDSKRSYTHRDGEYGKNVIIFGADMSSSKLANNKTKSVLVLGRNFV